MNERPIPLLICTHVFRTLKSTHHLWNEKHNLVPIYKTDADFLDVNTTIKPYVEPNRTSHRNKLVTTTTLLDVNPISIRWSTTKRSCATLIHGNVTPSFGLRYSNRDDLIDDQKRGWRCIRYWIRMLRATFRDQNIIISYYADGKKCICIENTFVWKSESVDFYLFLARTFEVIRVKIRLRLTKMVAYKFSDLTNCYTRSYNIIHRQISVN